MIKKEKVAKWETLCNDLDQDPWGNGYKIVRSKLSNKPRIHMDDQKQLDEFQKLFPVHPNTDWTKPAIEEEKIPDATTDEVKTVLSKLKN